MPQMAPINWLSMYMLFTIIFMISMILIYYMFNYPAKSSKIFPMKPLLSWKW